MALAGRAVRRAVRPLRRTECAGLASACARRAVVVHLRDQRVDAVELRLRPDPADEGDVERLAVEVAREIEQEDFEQRRAVVEGRPAAEARDAVVAPPPTPTRTA